MPDLLTTISNGLGSITSITYRPSSEYTNSLLPFIVNTVSSVTIDDGLGMSPIITYDYSGGYYDYDDRELRGFQYVKSTGPNGTTTETWFHQDDIFKGRIDEQIISDSSGNIYTWIENTYQSTSPYTGVDYPYLGQTDNYIYDGDNAATPRHIINQFTYDNYGNITRKNFYGDVSVSGDERVEYTKYFYDATNWIMSLPEHTCVSTVLITDCNESNGNLEAKESFTYYPSTGNLQRKESWLDGGTDAVTTYEYDQYGNINKIIDPKNNSQTITYDSTTYTYPIEIKNALNQTTQMTYDLKFGKLKTKTDPNGNTITYDYDEFGRLIKVTNPAPYGITEYFYQNFGDPYTQNVREEAKDRSGTLIYWKETYFDGLGRTRTEKSGGPGATTIVVDTEYNEKGLVYRKSLPYYVGDPTYNITYTYDPVDRLIQTLNPDGTFSTIEHDRHRTTYIDANGHKKIAEKDMYGRIIEIEEYTGSSASTYNLYTTTIYDYDVLGNLTYVRDEYGNETIITYDTLSRKTSMDDPDMGHWEYNYDANGNLTYQKDAKLQEITFEYDELNRIKKKIYPDATYIEYKYDEAFSTNATGRLTTLTDLSGTTKFYYDEIGQINRTDREIDSSIYTSQTQYDALGRVEKIIYPDNTEIDYTYDGHGNIEMIRSGPQTFITYNSYNAFAQPLSVTYGNGATTLYQYYAENNRLFSIATSSPSAGGLMNLEYYYDNVGNIIKIIDYIDNDKTRDFVYDHLDRLIEVDSIYYGGKLIYQYDKIGNMTYNCRYGYYFYEDPNHIHAVTRIEKDGQTIDTYSYDDNGNMISGAGRTLTYDYDNRPVSITYYNNETVSIYDANGSRVKKVTPTSTTTYIGQSYECTDGICTKYIFAGIQRVANIKGSETYYYHTDHLESSSIITDLSGNKAQDIYYYPYGEIKTNTGSDIAKHKFTGKEWDAETGLYYYGARYYDPKLAKFISADTIVPLPLYPQSFNRYSYTYNNPIVIRDLDGHFPYDIWDDPWLSDPYMDVSDIYSLGEYPWDESWSEDSLYSLSDFTFELEYPSLSEISLMDFSFDDYSMFDLLDEFYLDDIGFENTINFSVGTGDTNSWFDSGSLKFVTSFGGHIPAGKFKSWGKSFNFENTYIESFYEGSTSENVWGSWADFGISGGMVGFSGVFCSSCEAEVPKVFNIGLGKYSGVQFHFRGWYPDGVGIGVGFGLSLPLTVTVPVP